MTMPLSERAKLKNPAFPPEHPINDPYGTYSRKKRQIKQEVIEDINIRELNRRTNEFICDMLNQYPSFCIISTNVLNLQTKIVSYVTYEIYEKCY